MTQDHDISGESDTAESETSEPASLRTLEEVKEFMTSVPAFLTYAKNFELGLKLDKGNDSDAVELEIGITLRPGLAGYKSSIMPSSAY